MQRQILRDRCIVRLATPKCLEGGTQKHLQTPLLLPTGLPKLRVNTQPSVPNDEA